MFRENFVPRLVLLVGHELQARLDNNQLIPLTLNSLIACANVVSDVCLKLLEREGDALRCDALDGVLVGLDEKVRIGDLITAEAAYNFNIITIADSFGFGNGSGEQRKRWMFLIIVLFNQINQNVMNLTEDSQPLIATHSLANNTKHLSFTNSTVTNLLILLFLLLLVYGHHIQGDRITQISQKMTIELNSGTLTNETYLNSTLYNYNFRIRILEQQVQLYRKAIHLDLVLQMQQLNQSLSNMTQIIEQLDQSLENLEAYHRYQHFITRKRKLKQIIDIKQTKQSLGDQYKKYGQKILQSLNNINNPYYDIENRRNHTLQMLALAEQEYQTYQQKYNIDKYNYQISMCIIVPTRNNTYNHRFVYNIQSILNQNYSNYFIVVVDDHSDDKTGVLVERYLRRNGISKKRAVVVRKEQREGSLSNTYFAVNKYCKDYTVTFQVDGDDQLLGIYVFKLFNAIYQSKNPGFTYSNHVYYSENQEYISKGYSKAYSKLQMQKQNYRKIVQKFGHLRSFRTELFLKINEQDLRDSQGRYYMAAGDEAYIFPILQMSCKNIEYIDEATYIYNGATGNNVRWGVKKLQQQNALYIRLQKKYSCLRAYQDNLLE